MNIPSIFWLHARGTGGQVCRAAENIDIEISMTFFLLDYSTS